MTRLGSPAPAAAATSRSALEWPALPTVLTTAAILLTLTLAASLTHAQSSTGTSGSSSSAVAPFVVTFSGAYPIDWSLVPDTQPALSIATDTELGTCICDLTVSACDVNCVCDADCSVTEINRFSATLDAGPKSQSIPTCLDPDLVTVNQRGALTVDLVQNMICVTENNNPSLGRFFNPMTSISDTAFSAARSSAKYNYEPVDPLANEDATSTTTADTNYLVGSIIRAAHQDLSITSQDSFFATNDGHLVVPAAGVDGECEDGNYMRYLSSGTNKCRRTVTDLESACVTGGVLDGTPYVMNLKVGKVRTATPASTTLYIAMNFSAAYNLTLTGSLLFTGYQTYSSIAGVGNSSSASLGSYELPRPTWDSTMCTCNNVLASVAYVMTNEAAGSLSSNPAPSVQAIVTQLKASDASNCTGPAYIDQSFSTKWQLSNTLGTSLVIRPRSGNPGYLVGRPVLSGVLKTQEIVETSATTGATSTVTRQSIAQDTAGLTLLPHTSTGSRCTTSGGVGGHSVLFGQDAKFACYLPLTVAQLQMLCESAPALAVRPYFGNVSTSLGVWGSSDFLHTNEWVTVDLPVGAQGVWNAATRTCAGLTTSLNLEVATIDAGAFKNPQTRILAAKYTFAPATWRFTHADATASQLFPVFAAVSFIHLPATGASDYTPSAPPLLPKFPSDLLYPLYIENSARTATSGVTTTIVAMAIFATLAIGRRWGQ